MGFFTGKEQDGFVSRGLLIMVCVAVVATKTHAQERPTATLRYDRPGEACPSEQGFRDVVAGRMGYDPFVEAAAIGVDARVEENDEGFVGVIVIRESDELIGERVLSTPAGECQELVESMAVAVSIVLDPFGTVADSTDPEVPTPPDDPPPAREETPSDGVTTRVWAGDPNNVAFPFPEETNDPDPEEADEEGLSMQVTMHGGVFVGAGTAPSLTLGPILGAGVRFRHVSLLVDGRLDAMVGTHTTEDGDELRATVFSGGPTLCAHFGLAMACAGGQFGAFRGRATSVRQPRTVSTFVAFADFAGGVSIPLTPVVEFRALVELRVPLVRTTLSIEGESVWNAPVVSGDLRLGVAITI